MRGVVRSIPAGKNFGFILDQDGNDRFFYGGSMSTLGVKFDELEVGDTVVFEPIEAPDGRLRAVTVALYAKEGDQEMSAPNFTPMEGEYGQEESDRPPTARYGNHRDQGD